PAPKPNSISSPAIPFTTSVPRRNALLSRRSLPGRSSGRRRISVMPENSEEYHRIQKLPPYVFAVINEMRAKARASQIDVIDLGMGNPDGATPRVIVNKLVEASRNARNHRYSQSRGIPALRREIAARYKKNY